MTLYEYEKKKARLIKELLRAKQHGQIGLAKSTSNLFRQKQQGTAKINVRNFNKVISIDAEKQTAEVEGMTTYEDFVRETLRHGMLPAVVPELKSITVGGALSGGGIESSSFKYGLVHETVLEMEVLLGNGSTVTCSRKRNSDLFFGIPNSYGTLGYILKLKAKLVPAKKYVKLEHSRFNNAKSYFKAVQEFCRDNYDFIDGTVFNENELYLTLGKFVAEAPSASNYKYMRTYYKSIHRKKTDYLTASDYIWRWDPDWFWCSKHFFMQNFLVRLLLGPLCLKSTVYWKIMAFNRKYKVSERLSGLFGRNTKTESVIQDAQIPIENCTKFLAFFCKEIGIKPIWICPTKQQDNARYSLYLMKPSKLYVNFGFWDVIPTIHEDGFYNKRIERKVQELNGKKSLYSTSFYTPEEFWKLYNKKEYDKLKSKYDPAHTFKDLYEKCVKKSL